MSAPKPDAKRALELLGNVAYFNEHEPLLQEVLDEMVEAARVNPGDSPALTFSAVVSAMATDSDRAVTMAALAVMRLAAIERPGGAS